MKKYFLLLIALFSISCKKIDIPPDEFSILYFENPQPINDSELSKIPNKFRGLFMNSDSTYLNIKEKSILVERYYKYRFHKKDMDSIKDVFDFVNNRYVSKYNHDVFDYRYLGDSIELSNKEIDTFFVFSKRQKAKRIDGQLILNYQDSIYWKINAVSLEKNVLKIKYMYSEEDLKRIDSVTKIKSAMIDSTLFILKPSRNEFKRILNIKDLGETAAYKKVKNN